MALDSKITGCLELAFEKPELMDEDDTSKSSGLNGSQNRSISEQPFARVNSVAADSPAAEAVSFGDLLRFG